MLGLGDGLRLRHLRLLGDLQLWVGQYSNTCRSKPAKSQRVRQSKTPLLPSPLLIRQQRVYLPHQLFGERADLLAAAARRRERLPEAHAKAPSLAPDGRRLQRHLAAGRQEGGAVQRLLVAGVAGALREDADRQAEIGRAHV